MIDRDLIQRALGFDALLPEIVFERLRLLEALVLKWNPSINVVAKSTLSEIGSRHIADSAQLFRCVQAGQSRWLDLGSGGGFPGLVIAILADSLMPELKVALVESDKRKAVFLTEASRQLSLTVQVLASRIESLSAQRADVISARALAPLGQLLNLAVSHLAPNGTCAFLKGAGVDAELEDARKEWVFEVERTESVTDPRSSALFLRGLAHV